MSKKKVELVSKKAADHVVARVCEIKAGDSKVEAALKVIETMRLAGWSTKSAERMLEAYKRQHGITS